MMAGWSGQGREGHEGWDASTDWRPWQCPNPIAQPGRGREMAKLDDACRVVWAWRMFFHGQRHALSSFILHLLFWLLF